MEAGMNMSAKKSRPGITFFDIADAPLLDDTDMMSPPYLEESVYTELDLVPTGTGAHVKALHRGEGENGFSLVHAWFGKGYRLPQHSHNADCLYYIVAGSAILGSRELPAGAGFFVPAGRRYAYVAGDDGVEILEFRMATSWDMQIYEQTVDRWRPIVAAAVANQDEWLRTRPTG